MRLFPRIHVAFLAILALILTAASLQAGQSQGQNPTDDDYDRLDGMGESGKRVNVIEWEGNLEIHVYPKGSLQGLALKIDDTNKDRPVMVIGYRFDKAPKKQIIRRNVLAIDLTGFKAFRDPSAEDYDKIILSRNGLAGGMKPFALDPQPTQLYPDGHPKLAEKKPDAAPSPDKPSRSPASAEPAGVNTETGGIKPFFQ